MIMWIILGALVGIVIIFIIVTSVMDKKKKKKQIEQLKKQKIASNDAIVQTLIVINLLIEYNDKKLNTFVPSIGKLKMGDIVSLAKSEISNLSNHPFFRKLDKEEENVKAMFEILEKLRKTKSNMWQKNCQKEINRMQKLLKEQKNKREKFLEFEDRHSKRLKKLYNL
ncbi:MAG: hypothetical protein NC236_02180 [Mycoplasma sp.]|nr:hypothetical protein [Mycoplasma sp.]